MLLSTTPGPTPVGAALGAGAKMVASWALAAGGPGSEAGDAGGGGSGVLVPSAAFGARKTVRLESSGISGSSLMSGSRQRQQGGGVAGHDHDADVVRRAALETELDQLVRGRGGAVVGQHGRQLRIRDGAGQAVAADQEDIVDHRL